MKTTRFVAILALMFAISLGSIRASTPAPVSAEEKAAVTGVIKELYQAYSSRNLDRVMALEHDFIETAAHQYEQKKGPGKGDEFRDAFRGVTEEILKSKDFGMKPLHLQDVEYRRDGDRIVVSGVVPIIATEYVEVQGDGTGNKARLRIGKFTMKKDGAAWRIEQMDLQG